VKKRHRARFRLVTIIQVLFLVATALLLIWSVFDSDFTAVPIVLAAIIVLQVIGLIRSVESHVDTLEDFFSAVNYEDFTRRFVEDDVDSELKVAFNRVLERFQDARAQRDVQAGYLETVVRHVPIPFIAARADGTLNLVNNPARRLTGLPGLTHIDQLGELDPELPGRMGELRPGSQQLIQSRLRGVPAELRVSVSEIRLDGGVERLYSIENLSGELTARESSAWRNLIRVLTHEIMNTLTPVTSLAQPATGMLDDESARDDIREAVQTIARRSEGLMNFVLRYREMLKVPQPDMTTVTVSEALHGIVTLMSAELDNVEVQVSVSPKSLEISADTALLDQVLVNVVKNALDAIRDGVSPQILLQGRLDFGRTVISITDNGPGMDDETIDQVFVPFFTTKRDGSGIGLSLCRQIMTAHGGEIAVESSSDGTTVRLIF
jgi:nitrogen fixation/metabolism regulation signal transduction histidine kinase